MIKKYYHVLIVLLIQLCLWIIYIFDSELANYGIYTIIDYSTHEILSLIPLGGTLVTIILLILVLKKNIRYKTLGNNIIVIMILVAAAVGQIGYIFYDSDKISITTVGRIEKIDPHNSQITVNKSGERLVLECPMIIYELLEIDDREYLISYQTRKSKMNQGRVSLIQLIND